MGYTRSKSAKSNNQWKSIIPTVLCDDSKKAHGGELSIQSQSTKPHLSAFFKSEILLRFYLGIILVLGACFHTKGQGLELEFENISVEQGLPHLLSLYIEQDKLGFIWIGTWGGGLIRYDGYKFEKYDPKSNDQDTI